MDAENDNRGNQDWPASESVAERTQEGGAEKLHQGVAYGQRIRPVGLRGRVRGVFAHEERQNRERDPDSYHIDKDRSEDEPLARAHGNWARRRRLRIVHGSEREGRTNIASPLLERSRNRKFSIEGC